MATTWFVCHREAEAAPGLQQVQLPEPGLGRGQWAGWCSQLQDSQSEYCLHIVVLVLLHNLDVISLDFLKVTPNNL